MYRISESRISESDIFISSSGLPVAQFPWKIELFPQGKSWYLGAENVPIQSVDFNLAEKGCMDAKIKYAALDFPIYYGNEINIYYNGEKKYRGYISTLPDPVGDTINISPYHKRFEEVRLNSTWTNVTFLEMLSETITTHTTETNVYYNPSMVLDYNATSIYGSTKAISYKYEKISKLIDDYYEKVDDIYWGVEANGYMYLKKRNSNIDYYIYSGANQAFQEIKPKKDYAKIKETRYDVFQKSTVTNENEYIATIPDGTTTYPISPNEAIVGTKYSKLTAPDGLNSTECKDYAYAKIVAQLAPENTKIKGLDIRRFDLKIGQRVKIWSEEARQLKDLISCDSTENWHGNVSIDTDYIEGSGSITFGTSDTVYYDFEELQNYLGLEKILFMIKSDNPLSYNIFSLGENYTGVGMGLCGIGLAGCSTNLAEELFTISENKYYNFKLINNWNLIEINTTAKFRYLGFMSQSTQYATVKIDDIKIYGYVKNSYEGNVIKLSYGIDAENQYLYDVEIGDESQKANDLLFKMQKKIDVLESNNQG